MMARWSCALRKAIHRRTRKRHCWATHPGRYREIGTCPSKRPFIFPLFTACIVPLTRALLAQCSVDAWAIGILGYELIVGHPPFERETRTDTYEQIMYRRPNYPAWISEESRMFISAALTKVRRDWTAAMPHTELMLTCP